MKYLTKNQKSTAIVNILEEALDILVAVGIPLNNKTEKSLEKMAMAFLAVAGVTETWSVATDQQRLKTRDIINFINEHFEEHISRGSYDDIRRKDLKLLVLAGLILNRADKPQATTNDSTRGYQLETNFKNLVLKYKMTGWKTALAKYRECKISLQEQLARKRNLEKVPVTLPNGKALQLSTGPHNVLQKLIIEEFLPRYGKRCEVLYVGDTANKMLHIDQAKLESLKFTALAHDELPDIIAYHSLRNWLYLIEAVHSSGAISETRLLEL